MICEKSGAADLEAIRIARGLEYNLTDRTPWCQKLGCLGRAWFSVRTSSWMRKLLTAEGEARLEAHSDWVFAEHHRLRKAKTKDAAASAGKG